MCDIIRLENINKEISVEILCSKIMPRECDIVFVAGSLIEGQVGKYSSGVGNMQSDIDVFIVTDNISYYENVVYNETFYKTMFFSIEGLSYDLEIYEYDKIMHFLMKLDSIDFKDSVTDDIRTINLFDMEKAVVKKYMSFIHRFLNSIPICNYDGYQNMKNKINKENYFIYNKRYYVNIIDLFYDDAVGYIQQNQGVLASCMARNLLQYAVCAYLYSKGVSFDREKWTPLLLENFSKNNVEARDVFIKYINFLFLNEFKENADFIKYAKKVLSYVNELIDDL